MTVGAFDQIQTMKNINNNIITQKYMTFRK